MTKDDPACTSLNLFNGFGLFKCDKINRFCFGVNYDIVIVLLEGKKIKKL